MTSQQIIDRLAQLLERDEPVLLGQSERALVRSALAVLAATAQRTAHLERLLEVNQTALGSVAATAEGATDGVEHLTSTAGVPYDFAAARTARARLEESVRAAGSAADIIAAALSFARDATLLAG